MLTYSGKKKVQFFFTIILKGITKLWSLSLTIISPFVQLNNILSIESQNPLTAEVAEIFH
jgi:hypothetical protein